METADVEELALVIVADRIRIRCARKLLDEALELCGNPEQLDARTVRLAIFVQKARDILDDAPTDALHEYARSE